ncbi:MAG: hypothetical protein HYV41_02945 [Candidatus Magasanikbacteria bacterium]|nr:hypothetical protein [Candidatus Magasanikbacteria bacterium]
MKNKIIGALILVFVVFVVYFFIFDKTRDSDEATQENSVIESNPEYHETYLTLSYSKSEVPQSLDALGVTESKIFIEKINEQKLDPKNMLQAGNELYFISSIEKEGVQGQGVLLYDIIDRKLYVLFFRSLDELEKEGRTFVLTAIDVVNNKIILAYAPKTSVCESKWLGAVDDMYSLDLYTGKESSIAKYIVPKWKIDEERVKYPDCIL